MVDGSVDNDPTKKDDDDYVDYIHSTYDIPSKRARTYSISVVLETFHPTVHGISSIGYHLLRCDTEFQP